MNVAQSMASVLKKEGVDFLFCYPTTAIIDAAAAIGIRPVVVRQERSGIHMADAYSRLSSGEKLGAFAMQHGPGAENSYGGVAQAYADSVPVLILPQGYPQKIAGIKPNFSSAMSMRDVAKSTEALTVPNEIPNVMRRAFSELRNGRGGPVVVEVPADLWNSPVANGDDHVRVKKSLFGPDPADVTLAVDALCSAQSLVIHAGQGVHYSKAWAELKELAELLGAPVSTTLPGKSAFPEDHPLALGSGGLAYPLTVKKFLDEADVIFGVGCSFTETVFAVPIQYGKRIVHLTIDPGHLNKDMRSEVGLVGDAKLGLSAIITELKRRQHDTSSRSAAVAAQIAVVRTEWLAQWEHKLNAETQPLSPYRVIKELMLATHEEKVVLTHDAGRPRDQLTPFWVAREPLSFIGWGKTTQLGYGLPLAMGAKLARPDHVCINVWGDAAIGFTGTEFETAVREEIPVLSILFNNQGMATEKKNIPIAIEKYAAADISGHYADMATALGCYAERITEPSEIAAAIRRGIEQTKEGRVVLLEFITAQEVEFSRP